MHLYWKTEYMQKWINPEWVFVFWSKQFLQVTPDVFVQLSLYRNPGSAGREGQQSPWVIISSYGSSDIWPPLLPPYVLLKQEIDSPHIWALAACFWETPHHLETCNSPNSSQHVEEPPLTAPCWSQPFLLFGNRPQNATGSLRSDVFLGSLTQGLGKGCVLSMWPETLRHTNQPSIDIQESPGPEFFQIWRKGWGWTAIC